MPASRARQLFENPAELYANYEKLVGAGLRAPAPFANDQHRCAVSALLFGSYANRIVYGALSLTTEGLPTYGAAHCRLRPVSVKQRTSFLQMNSFNFVKCTEMAPGDPIPPGYMASWGERHSLVLAKLADRLSVGQTESEWQAMLIASDGVNRHNDDFVEAHVYGGFDCNAIESLARNQKRLSRQEELDMDIAMSRFEQSLSEGEP